MHPLPLGPDFAADCGLAENISWWDSDAECTVVMSQPTIDPGLWEEYLRGAERSYRRHGVERALDIGSFRDGVDTAAFWATLDATGRVIGGLRAKGPLDSAEDSHATIEWAGRPGLPAVRKMIEDRIPFGVLEMKSAWTTDDRDHARRLSKVLARTMFQAMTLMEVQFAMATSAPHVLEQWRTSGALVAPIPATPYPDDRYRTKMMWWDRRTFARFADPFQHRKIIQEMTFVSTQARAQRGSFAVVR